MPKEFNVTGLCIPEKNYMVDISGRIDIIVQNYISKGKYFTINRARQYGKTTTLYLLEQRLKDQYMVIRLSFEAADEMFASLYALTVGLVRKIGRILKMQGANASLVEEWELPVSKLFPLDDLGEKITALCRCSGKEIVLIVDEVDKSSDNQIFLSFLGLLRNKYLDQQQQRDATFHSVILAGVYDVKNLKLKLHPGEESKYNSPWNVAADFTMDLSFRPDDIAGMLAAYENDCHTGMDIPAFAQWLYDYTDGYLYMVSRLCMLIDEQVAGSDDFPLQKDAWTKEGFLKAVRIFLQDSNTLFDDVVKTLEQYPLLKDRMKDILFRGTRYSFENSSPIINGAGNYYIEAQTRDRTRTNVIVDYRGQRFIVELKLWRGDAYHKRGEQQLLSYLDYYNEDTWYLLSFNFNKKKQTGMHEILLDGKKILEVVV